MGTRDTGVVLHIDDPTSHDQREEFRDELLAMDGVMAAAYHDERPHLMVIIFDSNIIKSIEFVNAAKNRGWRAELVGP